MVFAGENNVARSCFAKDRGHFIGVPFLNFTVESRRKVIVVEIRAIVFAMIGLRWRAVDAHYVVVPLGVWVVLDVVGRREVRVRMRERSPARCGVESPMDEDSELRAGVPLRQRMTVERFEGGFVLHGGLSN